MCFIPCACHLWVGFEFLQSHSVHRCLTSCPMHQLPGHYLTEKVKMFFSGTAATARTPAQPGRYAGGATVCESLDPMQAMRQLAPVQAPVKQPAAARFSRQSVGLHTAELLLQEAPVDAQQALGPHAPPGQLCKAAPPPPPAVLSEATAREIWTLMKTAPERLPALQLPLPPPHHVRDALVGTLVGLDSALRGCACLQGCTAAVAVVHQHFVHVAHCGDSRIVLCRAGQAEVLTADHTPANSRENVSQGKPRLACNTDGSAVMMFRRSLRELSPTSRIWFLLTLI